MKKLFVLLVLVLLGFSAANAAGNLAVGTALGFPTLKYDFSKDISGQLGAMNASGGGASSTGILVKLDYNLQKAGDVQPNIGVFYATNGAAAATTSIGVTYGIGAMVVPNLSVGADIILVNSVTVAGASTTGILGPGLVGAGIPAIFNTVTLAASYYL